MGSPTAALLRLTLVAIGVCVCAAFNPSPVVRHDAHALLHQRRSRGGRRSGVMLAEPLAADAAALAPAEFAPQMDL